MRPLRSARCTWCCATWLVLLGALLLGVAPAAEDPYAAWRQGRADDAARGLQERARQTQEWTAWYDAGLAAAEAGDAGSAAACLLAAHRAAPERTEPLQLLRLEGAKLATTWCEWIGPLALLRGWWACLIAALGGSLLGVAAAGRIDPVWARAGALALLIALVPALAAWHDGRTAWAATLRPTSLRDSAGASVALLPAGTVLHQEAGAAAQALALVELADGRRGLVAADDLGPGH